MSPGKPNAGFTLIELMIVVAAVGILAVIAIPRYLEYSARSKVAELEGIAGACKTAVSEFYRAHRRMPASLVEAGCSGHATRYSRITRVTNGVVEIEAQSILPGLVDGWALAFRAWCGSVACDMLPTATSITAWRCDAAGAPTTIDPAYLPATCR